MKIIIMLLASLLIHLNGYSNHTETLLNHYIKVKDALVKSDSKGANENTIAFKKSIEDSKDFKDKDKLLKAVQKMSLTTDIEKIRNAFADVSKLMWKVVNGCSDLKQDVYYFYCPMKKMYWISLESKVINPYYGSKMLTCGNLSAKKTK